MAVTDLKARTQQRLKRLAKEFCASLPKAESAVVFRIAGDERTPDILGTYDDETVKRLFDLCLEADLLFSTFEQRMREIPAKLNELDERKNAVSTLKRFAIELKKPLRDRLEAKPLIAPDEIDVLLKCLALFGQLIRFQRVSLIQGRGRFGKTHKSHGKKAAETAAIGWLAEGVNRITRMPNIRLVADLAEVLLSCEVSLDRAKNAARTRKREWRTYA